jgi:hypothetical protein
MTRKRKCVVVSLDKKWNATKHLDQGETIKKLASDLCVGEVTVGDWRRKRVEIEKWCPQRASVCSSKNLNRKQRRKENLNKLLKLFCVIQVFDYLSFPQSTLPEIIGTLLCMEV